MKILQLNIEKGWRGGERQTLFCMQEFARQGHQVELVARTGHELAKRATTLGFTVHTIKKPWQLWFWLLRHGSHFDIIHSQTANSLTWAVLAKLFYRAKLVFTRRTAFPVPANKCRSTQSKWRKADLFVSISHLAAQEPKRLGIQSTIIPSAIKPYKADLEKALYFKQSLDIPEDRIILGTTAALTREKDPLTMIQAVYLLKQRHYPVVFLHFGAHGDSSDTCKALIGDLALEQDYRLMGYHESAVDYISLMQVFTMCSSYEALGSSVLDAFMQRIPVVSTNAGGLKELLGNDRGILCPIGDAKAIADAIEYMLKHPNEAQFMSERAWKYVRRHHDVQSMGERYIEAFEKLLAARSE